MVTIFYPTHSKSCVYHRDQDLNLGVVRMHKKAVMKHGFERGAKDSKSVGYWVPTGAQVNAAIDRLDVDFAGYIRLDFDNEI